jgi:hypothetical protein
MLIENALPGTTAAPLQIGPGHAKADTVPRHSMTLFFDAVRGGANEEVSA